jgi:hypothetical protein
MWARHTNFASRTFEFNSRVLAVGFADSLSRLPFVRYSIPVSHISIHIVKVSIPAQKMRIKTEQAATVDQLYHNLP